MAMVVLISGKISSEIKLFVNFYNDMILFNLDLIIYNFIFIFFLKDFMSTEYYLSL